MNKLKTLHLKWKLLLFSLLFSPTFIPQVTHARGKLNATPVAAELTKGLKIFLKEYRVVVGGVVGFGVMTGILAFVYLLSKLAAVADQPQARAEVLKELLMVGVTTSLLGAFGFIVGIYYSIMMNG